MWSGRGHLTQPLAGNGFLKVQYRKPGAWRTQGAGLGGSRESNIGGTSGEQQLQEEKRKEGRRNHATQDGTHHLAEQGGTGGLFKDEFPIEITVHIQTWGWLLSAGLSAPSVETPAGCS